jgi:hypothetical protein
MADTYKRAKKPKASPSKKSTNLPKKYTAGLNERQKAKQVKSIREGKERPQFKDVKTKRSTHVQKFEDKYGYKITDPRVKKEIISATGFDQIVKKGEGAYFSGGSRPNTNPRQWGLARVASVIMGGPARKVDKDIWEKYKK